MERVDSREKVSYNSSVDADNIKNTTQEEIKAIVEKIVSGYQPEKIILFGSFAREEARKDSDLDLLIIKRTNEIRPHRIRKVFFTLRGLNTRLPVDPFVYTPSELEKRKALGDFFIKRILNEGRVLYG